MCRWIANPLAGWWGDVGNVMVRSSQAEAAACQTMSEAQEISGFLTPRTRDVLTRDEVYDQELFDVITATFLLMID